MGECFLLRTIGFYGYCFDQGGLAWNSAVVLPGRLLPPSTTSDFRDIGEGRAGSCRGSPHQKEVLESTEASKCLVFLPSTWFWVHESVYLNLQSFPSGSLEYGRF